MFKSTLLILSFFILNLSFSQQKSCDSEIKKLETSFTAAISLPYSFHLNTIGINPRLYYNIGEHICFGPEASYFKKDDISILDLNFVGHYIFEIKQIGVYPLVGLNYTIENEPMHKEEELGFVFGAGFHKGFNKLMLFSEYSHVQSHLNIDDFITVGSMIHFE